MRGSDLDDMSATEFSMNCKSVDDSSMTATIDSLQLDYDFGDWATIQSCPAGSWIVAFQLRVDFVMLQFFILRLILEVDLKSLVITQLQS